MNNRYTRLDSYIKPEDKQVIFASILPKFLLNKDALAKIVTGFSRKHLIDYDNRENTFKSNNGFKCKKEKALDIVTSAEACYEINWRPASKCKLAGPYLIKNHIVIHNPVERLLLIVYCPPLLKLPVAPDVVDDEIIRKIYPFTYVDMDWEAPKCVNDIKYTDLTNPEHLTLRVGDKENPRILELIKNFNSYTWKLHTPDNFRLRQEKLNSKRPSFNNDDIDHVDQEPELAESELEEQEAVAAETLSY